MSTLDEMKEEIRRQGDEIESLRTEQAVQQVKSGVWGMVGGLAMGLTAWLFKR